MMPGYVRLLGLDLEIVEDETIGSMGQAGIIAFNENKIKYCPGLSDEKLLEIVLHEIVEGVNEALEIKLRHPQITSLARSFLQVLLDNPDLVEHIITLCDDCDEEQE